MEQVTHVSRLTFMKGKYKNRSNVTGLEPFKRHWIRTVQTSLDYFTPSVLQKGFISKPVDHCQTRSINALSSTTIFYIECIIQHAQKHMVV